MLSGIGPAKHLTDHGVTPIVDLPGVGQNLQDHLMVLIYFLARNNPGRALINGEAGLFVNTRGGPGASPDLQYHVLAGMELLPVAEPNFLLCPTLCKPYSRGQVELRLASPPTSRSSSLVIWKARATSTRSSLASSWAWRSPAPRRSRIFAAMRRRSLCPMPPGLTNACRSRHVAIRR